jgi:hypothetical protein
MSANRLGKTMAGSSGKRSWFIGDADRELFVKIEILPGLTERSGDLG